MSHTVLPHICISETAPEYTWVITENNPASEDVTRDIATVGPSGASKRASLSTVIHQGQRFSLLNPVGKTLYHGYIYGDFSGREPLADFGWQNGCTKIEFEGDVTQDLDRT